MTPAMRFEAMVGRLPVAFAMCHWGGESHGVRYPSHDEVFPNVLVMGSGSFALSRDFSSLFGLWFFQRSRRRWQVNHLPAVGADDQAVGGVEIDDLALNNFAVGP